MLELVAIAYNQPRLISEQIRLLRKHLRDRFRYTVVDASTDFGATARIEHLCGEAGVGYRGSPSSEHVDALNFAWQEVLKPSGSRYLGTLDHDIFPTRPTRLVKQIRPGFYGVGQRHPATGHLYLWPGFCFFDRDWLAGRDPDFGGIRDGDPRNNGDTGSGMWPLFADQDWSNLCGADHGYRAIREPDAFGLQSWGVELISDWLHFTNGSGWMEVPNPAERERLLFEQLEEL